MSSGVIIICLEVIITLPARRFVDLSEEEINIMKESAIPKSIKEATKFGVTLFQGRI